MRFNRTVVLFTVLPALFLPQSVMAGPLTVNFSSDPHGTVQFVSTVSGDSASFSFPPQPGNDFSITSTQNFTSGDLTGFLGDITGVFSYNETDIQDLGNGVLTAKVTPQDPTPSANQFIIHDGAFDFTADLLWSAITTTAPSGGVDSLQATVNLSNFHYNNPNPTGNELALKELANSTTGSVTATFTFSSSMDLNQILAQCSGGAAVCSPTFSGTMTASSRHTASSPNPVAAPEPPFYGELLLGLLGSRQPEAGAGDSVCRNWQKFLNWNC